MLMVYSNIITKVQGISQLIPFIKLIKTDLIHQLMICDNTLKPLTFEMNNLDQLVTVEYSAGKP